MSTVNKIYREKCLKSFTSYTYIRNVEMKLKPPFNVILDHFTVEFSFLKNNSPFIMLDLMVMVDA